MLRLAGTRAGEHAPAGDGVDEVVGGEGAQDAGNGAVADLVVGGELGGGGQSFPWCPFAGGQPAPQVVFDPGGGALGGACHSLIVARQDHLYPLDRLY